MIVGGISRALGSSFTRRAAYGASNFKIMTGLTCSRRTYATEEKPKKKQQGGDISQVPVQNIGVMADFYIPPQFKNCPISSWPKLAWRRLGLFVVNTYSIAKYKRETKLKLKFNDWKELAMEQFVRTNKVFSAACNKKFTERKDYITKQLKDTAGIEVIRNLVERSQTFPNGTKISWELVNIESNPKVISFNALPDSSNLTVYVQFVMKVTTKQKVTIVQNETAKETENIVTDNLVYTLDPFNDDQKLVGSLFESDHIRKVQPDASLINPKVMMAFTRVCGDLYRSNPKAKKVDSNKDDSKKTESK
jgi:protein MBA1